MYIFYVDEAGCTGCLASDTSQVQPVFALAGIILEQSHLDSFTREFLSLKHRFYPNLLQGEFLGLIREEVKGAELRKQIRAGSRDDRRFALGVMVNLLGLLERHNARILGRVYVKRIGAPMDGVAVYCSSVQSMSTNFQHFLEETSQQGIMILDSRTKPKNTSVSYSIFTQKFKVSGDAYNRLIDMPLFGHSDNHAGLQVADLLCSAFLFPMATYAYCLGTVHNVHVDLRYDLIRSRFGERLKRMQYRYQDHSDWWCGGITVSDGIGHQSGSFLFGPQH
ncbi:MAG: DUF3800 domain-containing protein [Verrucomicrobiia bacterium]|jgi:hypothetical protein